MIATAKRRGKAEYDRKKQRSAQREATLSALGREIGEIPRVANARRKNACRRNFLKFCQTYGNFDPEPKFNLPFSPDHLKAIATLQKCVLEGGFFAFAMPRSFGKSTLCDWAVLWALLFGHKKFIVLVACSGPMAAARLESIKDSLMNNPLLYADFPEVVHAIRHLEGDNKRSNGQTFKGKRTFGNWSNDEIVFADIAKSPAARSIVMTAGLDSSRIRGLNRKGRRPDFVLLDDPQTDESAKSIPQTDDREERIEKAIIGTEGEGADLSLAMPCTVIEKGDLADRFLDRKLKPLFQGFRSKMLYKFPDRMELWDEYKVLSDASLLEHGDNRLGNAFYAERRAEMDAGAEVAWPERKRKRNLSGLQYAMDLFYADQHSFASERQNEPLTDEADDLPRLTGYEVEQRVDAFKRLTCDADAVELVSHIDVQQDLLYWSMMAVGGGFRCQVVDYGTWPKVNRRLFSYESIRKQISYQDPKLGPEASVLRALNGDPNDPEAHPGLLNVLAEKTVHRDGGVDLRLSRGLVDIGNWDTQILAAIRQSKYRNIWMGAKGHSGRATTGLPMTQWKRHPGERHGLYWIIGKAKEGRYDLQRVLFGTNFWKSQLVARVRAPIGSPTSLTLFAGGYHKLYGEHLAAEYPVREELKDGSSWIVWKEVDGTENHWLDTAVGCLVAASTLGITLKNVGQEDSFAPKKPTKRRGPRVYYPD